MKSIEPTVKPVVLCFVLGVLTLLVTTMTSCSKEDADDLSLLLGEWTVSSSSEDESPWLYFSDGDTVYFSIDKSQSVTLDEVDYKVIDCIVKKREGGILHQILMSINNSNELWLVLDGPSYCYNVIKVDKSSLCLVNTLSGAQTIMTHSVK